MANKFSISYEALRKLEYIVSQKNRRAEAIKCFKLFKSYVTCKPDKKIIHISPLVFWHEYEVMSKPISYIKTMLECDKKEQNHSIAADLIEMILNHLNLDKEVQSLFIQTDPRSQARL